MDLLWIVRPAPMCLPPPPKPQRDGGGRSGRRGRDLEARSRRPRCGLRRPCRGVRLLSGVGSQQAHRNGVWAGRRSGSGFGALGYGCRGDSVFGTATADERRRRSERRRPSAAGEPRMREPSGEQRCGLSIPWERISSIATGGRSARASPQAPLPPRPGRTRESWARAAHSAQSSIQSNPIQSNPIPEPRRPHVSSACARRCVWAALADAGITTVRRWQCGSWRASGGA